MRVEVIQSDGAQLPPRVSYSQLAKFNQCGLRYYFSYLGGWSEPQTSALVGGSIAHEVIEHLYRLPSEERTVEKALELLREHGPRLLRLPDYAKFANDNSMKASVKEAIENLFALESPAELVVQPEHLEMELEVDINGVKFFGKVDRFTVDGVNRVTDYKTGKNPGRFMDDKLKQPYLYALAFKIQHDIDIDQVELIFLNAKHIENRPVDFTIAEQMGESLAKMRGESETALAASAWEARTGKLCEYCPFEAACPAVRADAAKPGTIESDNALIKLGLTRREKASGLG
ncbi:MAG: PD-(D/E)XK nuclease family protein [Actinobacteria bacterium]|nr:PD-(D/E)XK nuclease family protein [Actinomycetota bacterium]